MLTSRNNSIALAFLGLALWASPASQLAMAQPHQNPDEATITLAGKFGSVLVDTRHGALTNLKLRNPDGSLPTQALTEGHIGTSLAGHDGKMYASQYGSPRDVVVRRDAHGTAKSVELIGISLRQSPALSPVAVGGSTSVLFSTNGKWAYATHMGGGSITRFDPSSGAANAPIKLPGCFPTGAIEAANGHLFIACDSRIPPVTEPVVPPNTAPDPGKVIELDAEAGTVVNTIPVGANPKFLAVTPDGKTVLVPNHGSDSVTVIDALNAKVRTTISVGPGPVTVAVSPDGSLAYVTNMGPWPLLSIDAPPAGSDTITPIDLVRLKPLEPIVVGPGPFGAAVTPDGKSIVVSLSRDRSLVVINRSTGKTTKRIAVRAFSKGGFPSGLALSPDGSTAYVSVPVTTSVYAPRSVVPVDLTAGMQRDPLPRTPRMPSMYHPTGPFANGVAVSRDGKLLLAADWLGPTVSRYALDPPQLTAPATEDWNLSLTQSGALEWEITQHWHEDFSGTGPSGVTIPFALGTTSTLWYEPERLSAPGFDPSPKNKVSTSHFRQTVTESPTWAIYKLWSPYHFQSDLKLDVTGGFLTRLAGSGSSPAHAGAAFDSTESFTARASTKRSLTLRLSASDKYQTGYQLNVDIPDKQMQRSLGDLYQSVLNGGSVVDQKGFWFGNSVSGVLTAYQAYADSAALNVGVPGRQPASAHAYPIRTALQGYFEAIFESIDEKGKLGFGFSGLTGAYQDAMLMALLGLYQYTIHTGDLSTFQRYESTVNRILLFWLSRVGQNGLVLSHEGDGNYHDVGIAFGKTYSFTYINVLVYRALVNMADLQHAIAQSSRVAGQDAAANQATALATRYADTASKLRLAINQGLWTPDSPRGPMYADWINGDTGEKAFYFMGDTQYAAIAFGIADQAQAKQILATADRRIAELTDHHGYKGTGTLTVLWPFPPELINYKRWPFRVYENGGMLLYQTYYEVVARAVSGDADGAYSRLAGFARGFDETSWWGDNGASMNGVPEGGSGELYLQDMVFVPAALVQGILGINGTWDELTVKPALPRSWHRAQANILYRGQPYCIKIDGNRAERLRLACSR